jgi:cold shock CspA family protein
MSYATILFYDRARCWGFAVPDEDGSSDVFLHIRNFLDKRKVPKPGDRISYELGERQGRTNVGLKIQILETAPDDGGGQ